MTWEVPTRRGSSPSVGASDGCVMITNLAPVSVQVIRHVRHASPKIAAGRRRRPVTAARAAAEWASIQVKRAQRQKRMCRPDHTIAHRTRDMGGKKKGPTTTDELGNTVSVAELEERKAAEEARAAAKARREAKAAAAAAEKSGDGAGGDDEGDAGDASSAPVFLSLEDQLRALMIKQNDGAKLTGKERKMLAKAEKDGRLPPLEAPDENDAKKRKGPSALSAPESWARALEAVSVHVRGGGDGDDDTNATDAVVDVSGMDVSVRGVRLFEDASIKIARGKKVALLGANGSGKSTLVKLIASGRIKARVNDVACVAQELEGGARSAFDALVSCDHVTEALLSEESKLIDAMEAAETNGSGQWDDATWHDAAKRLGELGEELERRDAYAAEAKARRILAGLGFSDVDSVRPLAELSGGWRMRAALAQALFIQPGLLLLDEPTNHLDLPATLWLASYLSSPACAKMSALIVSHSADFVSGVGCDVLHLDHFTNQIVPHKGDVWNFLNGADARHKASLKAYDAQQKLLKEIKGGKNPVSGEKAIQKLLKTPGQTKLLERPKEYAVSFTFPASADDRPTIAVLDAGYTIPGRDSPIYENLRFSVHSKSRVALVGPNGCGKSTLLGLLTDRLQPHEGEVQVDRKLVIGRYDQHFDELLPLDDVNSRLSACSHLSEKFGIKDQDARKLLGQAGLESGAHLTPLRSLSGGQKSRVVFALLAATQANVLVLDEPTNHLDIESVEALIEGLNSFEGGIVVSTHDARVVEGLDECEVWVCGEGEGGIRILRDGNGGFSKYRDEIAAEVEARATRAGDVARERRRVAKGRGDTH